MVSEPRPRAPLRLIPGGAPNPDVAGRSDEELLRSVRDGDVAHAAAFHDRLRPVVDRVLTRLAGPRDPDYEDLAQRALMELVLSVDRFRGECPLDAWASVVVARVAYKHIRRRKLERRLFTLDVVDVPEPTERGTGTTLAYRALLRQVEKHLTAVDPEKAWTFVLHDVHGYDLKEISGITGASRAAVQSRLVRGRRQLHERLAKDPELRALLDDLATKEPP
jgi:RNA polymerase sigma-70 factor (ECF subfamily)